MIWSTMDLLSYLIEECIAFQSLQEYINLEHTSATCDFDWARLMSTSTFSVIMSFTGFMVLWWSVW
jgi:hypothetical protein